MVSSESAVVIRPIAELETPRFPRNAETRPVASIPNGKKVQLAAGIPMGRFTHAAGMCAAVAFLASREADYITGVVLPVDGGISI
ncbi:SDR family oxidoreductase [Streptomyces inhibens]|uniref:SDR family oxidoreductase n=1 Tax=Streptomyces inhibens TaxID=2293571 RepID=UPI001C6EF6E5|nr:SDR family oxidoreductase [Streptomyces inhibens]